MIQALIVTMVVFSSPGTVSVTFPNGKKVTIPVAVRRPVVKPPKPLVGKTCRLLYANMTGQVYIGVVTGCYGYLGVSTYVIPLKPTNTKARLKRVARDIHFLLTGYFNNRAFRLVPWGTTQFKSLGKVRTVFLYKIK